MFLHVETGLKVGAVPMSEPTILRLASKTGACSSLPGPHGLCFGWWVAKTWVHYCIYLPVGP